MDPRIIFLQNNLQPRSPQEQTGLVLHDAVRDPSVPLQSIQHLLDAFPDSINETDTTERPVTVRGRGVTRHLQRNYFRLPIHAALESGRYDVAHFLLPKTHDAARRRSGAGELCLHILFNDSRKHPPIQLVRDLIDSFPEALSQKDFRCCIPLHSGLFWITQMWEKFKNVPEEDIEIIRLMFEKHPAAAKMTCFWKRNILEMVVETGQIALVSMLTDVYPEEVLAPHKDGYSDSKHLIRACELGYADIVSHFLKKRRPSQLTLTSSSCHDLKLAIHAALANKTKRGGLTPNHVEIVRTIVEFAPQTMFVAQNLYGWLPIHVLAGDYTGYSGHINVALALAEYLINKSSEKLLRTPTLTQSRMLPIHLAVSGGLMEIIKLFAEKAPDTLEAKTGIFGDLPIHLAAWRGGLDLVQYLAEKAPETLHAKNADGTLPIHQAALKANLQIVQFLAEIAPETLHATRADGALPIHVAASRGSLDLVKWLAEKAPETLHCSTTGSRPGGCLPIHTSGDNMECLFYMATAAPTTLKELAPPIGALDGGGPMLHIAVNQGRFKDHGIHLKCFEFLLQNSPLETKDHYGDNILHIALHKRLPVRLLHRLLGALKRQKLFASLLLGTNWLGRTPLHYLNVADLDCMRLIICYCSREQLRQALQKKQKIYPQMTALHFYLHSWQLWKVKHERRHRDVYLVRQKGEFPSDSLKRIKLFVKSCPESLLMKDDGSVPFQTALRNEWPMEVCYYLAMSTSSFDLEYLSVATISDSVDIVYNYLSKFVGEWAN